MIPDNYIIMDRKTAIARYGVYYSVEYEANYEGFKKIEITENLGQIKLRTAEIFDSLADACVYCQRKSFDDYLMICNYHGDELKKYNKMDYLIAEINLFSKSKNQKIKFHHDILDKTHKEYNEIQNNHIVVKFIEEELKVFDNVYQTYDEILIFDLRNKPVIKCYRSFINAATTHISNNVIDTHYHIYNDIDVPQNIVNFKTTNGVYQYNNEDVYFFDDKEIANEFIINKLIEYKGIYNNEPELLNKQIHQAASFFVNTDRF